MGKLTDRLNLFRVIAGFALLIALVSCARTRDELDLSIYQYRDTRNLVRFAYDAAARVEEDGLEAIRHFRENREFYNREDYYLYIYKLNGENVFHAGMPELEGKNLYEVTDIKGKKITQLVLRALENKQNPHAWVHYSWWEPGKFYPVAKSSCHFKVKTPGGMELFVGAGMDCPHEEREFIRIIVDSAVDLIDREGEDAFEEIAEPGSAFVYRDVKVFVFDSEGGTIISPVIYNSPAEINFIESYDDAGHQPFKRALEEFRTRDSSWQVFMAKSRDKRSLVKKSLYLRKTRLNGKAIYVGAITNLPQPPWTD